MLVQPFLKANVLVRVMKMLHALPPRPCSPTDDPHDYPKNQLWDCLQKAVNELYARNRRGALAPSCTIGYFDDEVALQVFDTVERGFYAYVSYRGVHAPVIFLTLNSIELRAKEYGLDGVKTDG